MTAATFFSTGGGGGSNMAVTLYGGSGTAQNIITGKNNAAGSLTWIKRRDAAAVHLIADTVRGTDDYLDSASSGLGITGQTNYITSFNTDGFTLGTDAAINGAGKTYVAWTFLEASGFFDIVSYTGNATARTISHNLGATVGAIFVKSLTSSLNWCVYHRSLTSGYNLALNNSAGALTDGGFTATTTSNFSLDTLDRVNKSGDSFIAYLFAHNPSQGVACGSFTTNGSGQASVALGFTPRFLMFKSTSTVGTDDWYMVDTTRGWTLSPTSDAILKANVTDAENSSSLGGYPTSTGFEMTNLSAFGTYVYIAVR